MLFVADLSNPAAPVHVSSEKPIPVPLPPSWPQIVFCVITKLPAVGPVALINVPMDSPSTVLHAETTLPMVVVVGPRGPPRNRCRSPLVYPSIYTPRPLR